MPKFSSKRRVRHSAPQMFDLVADVERYPEFVPLCKSLKIRQRTPKPNGTEIVIADMTVSFKLVREAFTSRVTLDRPKANAIDIATSQALGQAFVKLRDDPDLRVGIITAAGDRIFSAGWDLKAAARDNLVGRWFQMLTKLFEDLGPALVYAAGGLLILQGDLKLGTVVAFVALLKRLYSPASDLAGVHVDVVTSYAYFDRIFAVLDLEPSPKLSRPAPSGQLPTLRAARAGQAILPS